MKNTEEEELRECIAGTIRNMQVEGASRAVSYVRLGQKTLRLQADIVEEERLARYVTDGRGNVVGMRPLEAPDMEWL